MFTPIGYLVRGLTQIYPIWVMRQISHFVTVESGEIPKSNKHGIVGVAVCYIFVRSIVLF